MIVYHKVYPVDKQMNKLVSDRVGICYRVRDTGEKEGAIGAFINRAPTTLSKNLNTLIVQSPYTTIRKFSLHNYTAEIILTFHLIVKNFQLPIIILLK